MSLEGGAGAEERRDFFFLLRWSLPFSKERLLAEAAEEDSATPPPGVVIVVVAVVVVVVARGLDSRSSSFLVGEFVIAFDDCSLSSMADGLVESAFFPSFCSRQPLLPELVVAGGGGRGSNSPPPPPPPV